MIEVKIGKNTYQVNDVLTIDQYQRFQRNQKLLNKPTPEKMLSLYLNIDERELKNAKKTDVDFVEKIIYTILSKDIDNTMTFTFDYEGKTYGFENKWESLAWGAWQDLEFLSSENITDNIHRILSVLYRPVIHQEGTKYVIEDYDSSTIESRAETFKNLPINIWFGASQVFFYISKKYTDNIRNTMEWKMTLLTQMEKGIQILPKWLQKRLRPDSILLRHLNSRITI